MKKFLAAFIAVLVLVPMFALSVGAVAPSMSAKSGTATVDGVISEGEYGAPFVVNSGNVVTWTNGTLDTEVKYYFTYAKDGLYVAISTPSAKIDSEITLQLNFNPGNLIPMNQSGLFLGMAWTKATNSLVITQHNHGTALQTTLEDGNLTSIITDKVTAVSKEENGNVIIEVKVPLDFFKIVSVADVSFSDFALTAGSQLSASPFIVLNGNGYATIGYGGTGSEMGWSLEALKLGKIELLKEGAAPMPNNPKTFDMGLISLAAVALTSVVAMKKRK